MKEKIISTINKEIEEYFTREVLIMGGIPFNAARTIKKIIYYHNSVFESGNIDDDGFRKFFYNINKYRCKIATKAVDIDVKDIIVKPENGDNYLTAWFFEKDLRQWMKDKQFGKLLNQIVETIPVYGTVVVKKANDNVMLVNLENLFVEQTAESLQTANYIIERHIYSPQELRNLDFDEDAVNTLIDTFNKSGGKQSIVAYERYGYLEDENGEFKKMRVVVGCCKEDLNDPKIKDGVILQQPIEITELPYKECHWSRMWGRWLGVGIVEELFENQVRVNEIINLKAKGLWWTSVKLYQTRDDMVSRNLLRDVQNGEIITVNSEITPIVNEERNLAAYREELSTWEDLADKQVFSYESLTGESLPSGTPLGLAVLQSQMAGSFFDFQRENIGLFLKDILMSFVVKIFEKERANKKQILNLIGSSPDTIRKFMELRKNWELNKRIIEFIEKNDTLPTENDVVVFEKVIEEKLRNPEEKFVEIPENYYKNLKYNIDIVITGENFAGSVKASVLQLILQMLVANPTLRKDKAWVRTLNKILEYSGINPAEIDIPEDITEEISGTSIISGQEEPVPLTTLSGGGSPPKPVITTQPEVEKKGGITV